MTKELNKQLNQIRKQIANLRKQEDKIILKLRKSYAQEKDTVKLPGVTKTTWLKKPGELHRTTIWRRAKKIKEVNEKN